MLSEAEGAELCRSHTPARRVSESSPGVRGRLQDGEAAEEVPDQKPSGQGMPGRMPRSLHSDCE